MFSAKQIAKIQKKAAPIVNKKLKEKEEKERISRLKEKKEKKEYFIKNILPHLKEMKKYILKIEKENPDRGSCICIWNNNVYKLVEDRVIRDNSEDFSFLRDPDFDINSIFDIIYSSSDNDTKNSNKIFIMMKKNIFNEEKECMDWISKNFSYFIVLENKIRKNQGDTKETLSNHYQLGSLCTKFQEKFPNKDISDFIKYMKFFKERMINCCN